MSIHLVLLKLRSAGIEDPRIEFSLGLGDAYCVHFKGNRGGQRHDLTQILGSLAIDFDLAGLAEDFLQGVSVEKPRGRR